MEFRSAAGLIERRINPASAEFRPELRMAGDSAHITGYGSVFNKLSRKLGGFVERVNDRAFGASQGAGWPGVVADQGRTVSPGHRHRRDRDSGVVRLHGHPVSGGSSGWRGEWLRRAGLLDRAGGTRTATRAPPWA